MGYRYRISTWHTIDCVIKGVRNLKGDLFEILSTPEINADDLEFVKEEARADWIRPTYKDKDKRLEVFRDNELVYMYDSKYGEWSLD